MANTKNSRKIRIGATKYEVIFFYYRFVAIPCFALSILFLCVSDIYYFILMFIKSSVYITNILEISASLILIIILLKSFPNSPNKVKESYLLEINGDQLIYTPFGNKSIVLNRKNIVVKDLLNTEEHNYNFKGKWLLYLEDKKHICPIFYTTDEEAKLLEFLSKAKL